MYWLKVNNLWDHGMSNFIIISNRNVWSIRFRLFSSSAWLVDVDAPQFYILRKHQASSSNVIQKPGSLETLVLHFSAPSVAKSTLFRPNCVQISSRVCWSNSKLWRIWLNYIWIGWEIKSCIFWNQHNCIHLKFYKHNLES